MWLDANGMISFFFMSEKYYGVYVQHIFFIHFSVNGQLGCVQVFLVTPLSFMALGAVWLIT